MFPSIILAVALTAQVPVVPRLDNDSRTSSDPTALTEAGEGPLLSDEAVSNAIAEGASKKVVATLSVSCWADVGFGAGLAANMAGGVQPVGSYYVSASTAEGRIAA